MVKEFLTHNMLTVEIKPRLCKDKFKSKLAHTLSTANEMYVFIARISFYRRKESMAFPFAAS